MVAYRRVYDSRHLQADCQEPGTLRSTIEDGLPLPFLYNCDELQVRGEELPAVVLPPPRLALPHRRLQPAADRDDARVLRGRRQVAVT